MSQKLNIELPEKLVDLLFTPSRYKVAYGGRGGAKSWCFARALLLMGRAKKEIILCAREIQKSIDKSVHALLKNQISQMGLDDFYQVQKNCIRGLNGTEFHFVGLKSNVDSIKSIEGITKVWVEEAHNVSKGSWDKLIPTIRTEGSEIWVSFNPELEEDETYKRFVSKPFSDVKSVKVNWKDNPWFPPDLVKEMLKDKATDYDKYLHVWEGHCRQILEGSVYADQIRKMTEENRKTKIVHDQTMPVDCYFDLGHSDSTAIWFSQSVNNEFRFINFYENQFKLSGHYIEKMQSLGYIYRRIILPHDAKNRSTITTERTVEEVMRNAFPNATVVVLPRCKDLYSGIEAARMIFNQCWFDEEKCSDGLHALRYYRYDKDPDTGRTSKKPIHDWTSHAADAFRYAAISIQEQERPRQHYHHEPISWMS